jgi:hypothetical protein
LDVNGGVNHSPECPAIIAEIRVQINKGNKDNRQTSIIHEFTRQRTAGGARGASAEAQSGE